jgi:mycofactocin precursor
MASSDTARDDVVETPVPDGTADEETLIDEVSIDGMCGVY